MPVSKIIKEILYKSVKTAVNKGLLKPAEYPEIIIEYPLEERFGDYTSRFAIESAKILRISAIDIGKSLKNFIEESDIIGIVNIVKPGYINIFLSNDFLYNRLLEINNIQNTSLRNILFKKIPLGKSSENQAFYIQYTYFRLCSILKESEKRNIDYFPEKSSAIFLKNTEINSLLRCLSKLYEEIFYQSENSHSERIFPYLLKLSQNFQRYHFIHDIFSGNKQRVITNLLLCNSIKNIIEKCMNIPGFLPNRK